MTFTVTDVICQFPTGSYDVITCVATIHHLPFTQALTCFRRDLAPGALVIVGLARAHTSVDHLLGAVAIPANAAMGWL
ncbi:class I SAM-dependent methyltransferase [Streptomyces lucensis]|nr:class I SAM-dependent methyltransferase [Streptomyces lucensis]